MDHWPPTNEGRSPHGNGTRASHGVVTIDCSEVQTIIKQAEQLVDIALIRSLGSQPGTTGLAFG